VLAGDVWFAPLSFVAPLWILVFAVLGAAMLGTLGLIAGLWADKFDQMAAFQNFIIMPMTFLSGVFYSIHSLPPFWQGEPPQPVLLHDRRLSLRLLRRQRRVALAEPGHRGPALAWSAASPCTCCASATRSAADRDRCLPVPSRHRNGHMTAEELKSIITAGLPCEHMRARGRRPPLVRHHRVAEFEGKRRSSATSGSMPRWAPKCDRRGPRPVDEDLHPAEWATH
jgi:hypothetical protein